jgi:hypothetical protein
LPAHGTGRHAGGSAKPNRIATTSMGRLGSALDYLRSLHVTGFLNRVSQRFQTGITIMEYTKLFLTIITGLRPNAGARVLSRIDAG